MSNKVKEESIDDIFSKDKAIKLAQELYNSGSSVLKLPNEALKLVTSINRGEVNFGVELNDSSNKVDKLEAMLHQIVIGFLDGSLILGASIVNSVILRNIYICCAFVLSVWLFIKMYIDHINKG